MKALTRREQRLVAVGLLAAALAAAWLGVGWPIAEGFHAREIQRQTLLTRYRANLRLLDSLPTLRTAAADQKRTAAAYQITAPTEALAAQALKQRLIASLTGAGGAVNAVQRVQANVPPGWVSVQADAVINLTQLNKSLRQLENEAPYVVVEYASLDADRALHSGHAAPLDIRLQIAALVHAGSAP